MSAKLNFKFPPELTHRVYEEYERDTSKSEAPAAGLEEADHNYSNIDESPTLESDPLQHAMLNEEVVEGRMNDVRSSSLLHSGSLNSSRMNGSWSSTSIANDSTLDPSLMPFKLEWSFGFNVRTTALNITTRDKKEVYYSTAHAIVVYDYGTTQMRLIQAHNNGVSSISCDDSGRWLVSADKGEDNTAIVWDNNEGIPINTIFDPHPGCGTASIGISGNAKYLATVGFEEEPIVKFWLWTFGKDDPDGWITLPSECKRAVLIKFNPNIQEHMMVAFRRRVAFLKWDTVNQRLTSPIIPTIRNIRKYGFITDCTYIDKCHECVASTSEGYVLVFGSTVYAMPYEEASIKNDKVFSKAIKISVVGISCIESIDGIIATGDRKGIIRFYDKRLKLLHWCQNFSLPKIRSISFNREPRLYELKDVSKFEDDDDLIESCSFENCLCEDRSEEYEYLYTQLVPTDATIKRLPFVVRDFIIATVDGRISQIDYINNKCNSFFEKSDAPVTAIEVHSEKPYIVIGYANGTISLYDYISHQLMVQNKLKLFKRPKKSESAIEANTCLKYSHECFQLACGRANGELWFLDPIALKPRYDPIRSLSGKLKKIVFSLDNIYCAYYDSLSTVALLRYCYKMAQWVSLGKVRSHYKPINDIMFSPYLPLRLFTIGDDRHLVEYNVLESTLNNLKMKRRERIEQTAVPWAFTYYPQHTNNSNERYILVADNKFKYKWLHDKTFMCRSVRLAPAYGCYKDRPITKIEFILDNQYLIFSNSRHIGIQKLPIDGNPYKHIGTTAHPVQLLDYRLCHERKYIFTFGKNDSSVLMWSINVRSVDILEEKGGTDIEPYYSLLEGGINGWLFKEMQDLFYFMQILQYGEDSMLPRHITDRIAVNELPDLMRGCGFFPSEYEIENLIVDVKYQNFDNTKSVTDTISFFDFVKLYVNHRPAYGISMEELRHSFQKFCASVESSRKNSISGASFLETICERGEIFTEHKAYTCLSTLMHADTESSKGSTIDFSFIPETISFDMFLEEILGVDNNRKSFDYDDIDKILMEEEEEEPC